MKGTQKDLYAATYGDTRMSEGGQGKIQAL